MSAINPLTNDELYAHAPSIFAEEPADGVSDRYAFVPTHTVLDTVNRGVKLGSFS